MTVATRASVLTTGVQTGVNDGQYLTLDTSALVATSGEGVTAYVFLTYDSPIRVVVHSGAFAIARYLTLTTPWGEQTAVLLRATGPVTDTCVLRLVLEVVAPVPWRGVLVTALGTETRQPTLDWRSGLALADPGERGLGAAFFAHGGSPVQAPDTLSPVVAVTDGADAVQMLSWQAGNDVSAGVAGGPWFASVIYLATPPPPPPPPAVRPPPQDSDDFWARRACCECADVFLINDEFQARSWDEGGSAQAALAAPDTLLLNHTEADGTRWSLLDIEGWWNLPPAEVPDLPRAGYLDGSFPVDGRYERRVITVKGAFTPPSDVSPAVGRLRVLRAADAVRAGALFVVKEPVWPKQAWVYLADQPAIATVDGQQRTEFEIPLVAVDPIKYHAGQSGFQRVPLLPGQDWGGRKYEPPEEQRFVSNEFRRYDDEIVGAATRAVNVGTTRVWPRIYIFGPVANPVVENLTTRQVMRFSGVIGDGEMVVADCHWRTVVQRPADVGIPDNILGDIAGENRRWLLSVDSQWIAMARGANSFRFRADTRGERANAMLVFRSGWMGS